MRSKIRQFPLNDRLLPFGGLPVQQKRRAVLSLNTGIVNGNGNGNDDGNVSRRVAKRGDMATIQDIARISGYSTGTVSRVINNRADVSDEARARIEQVIKEQNYQPNSNARMLRQSVSSELSIIVRGNGNVFYQSILEQVQAFVREHGETANVQFIGERENEVVVAEQVVQQLKPKGLVFLGASLQNLREGFSAISVPSVLISCGAEGLGFDNLSSFTTDDWNAAKHAVSVLVSQGHKRIGILGGYREYLDGPRRDDVPSLRVRGAVEELEKSGIEFDFERDYEPCPPLAEEGYQAAKRLLMRAQDLTAIFAIKDSIALSAMRVLQDMGYSVPKDISVVGFDGIIYTKYSVPRLTTIRQDVTALAEKGVGDLLMRISYEGTPVHEKVPYLFVNGESVARPR